MRRLLLALVLGLALCAGAAAAQPSPTPPSAPDVVDSSFATADGQRTLQESVVIDAPAAVLWQAFVDPAQFRRWSAPVMAIDLRVGGWMEAAYDPAKPIGDPDNIRHRIITFLPERLLVFQNIQAPHELPNADRYQRTVIVVQYEPLAANRTRVTLSCTGFATDPASQQIYAFFQKENAESLEKMKQVFGAPTAP